MKAIVMTVQKKSATSAAHIEIPDKLVRNLPPEDRQPLPAQAYPAEPDEEANAVFGGLRKLLRECRNAPKNHRPIVLIKATIGHGWNTRMRIVGTAQTLDFGNDHINTVLRNGTGDNPLRRHWARDGGGVYTVHDQAQVEHLDDADDRAGTTP